MTTLVDNTVPVAADFNNNFTALNNAIGSSTAISTYTTGDTLYASAANTLAKLSVGSAYQVMQLSSTPLPSWGGGAIILNRDVASLTVSNDAAATTVYSHSVAANALSTNRALRLTGLFEHTNNTGVSRNLAITVTYGGSTVYSATVGIAASANARIIDLDCVISAGNATNVQYAKTIVQIGGAGSTAGSAQLIDATCSAMGSNSALAVDSTSAQNLVVQVQLATASASLSIVALAFQLELLS